MIDTNEDKPTAIDDLLAFVPEQARKGYEIKYMQDNPGSGMDLATVNSQWKEADKIMNDFRPIPTIIIILCIILGVVIEPAFWDYSDKYTFLPEFLTAGAILWAIYMIRRDNKHFEKARIIIRSHRPILREFRRQVDIITTFLPKKDGDVLLFIKQEPFTKKGARPSLITLATNLTVSQREFDAIKELPGRNAEKFRESLQRMDRNQKIFDTFFASTIAFLLFIEKDRKSFFDAAEALLDRKPTPTT